MLYLTESLTNKIKSDWITVSVEDKSSLEGIRQQIIALLEGWA